MKRSLRAAIRIVTKESDTTTVLADRGFHMNPQEIRNGRPCIFCFQFSITQEHAKACPGAASDIRTWAPDASLDKDGS